MLIIIFFILYVNNFVCFFKKLHHMCFSRFLYLFYSRISQISYSEKSKIFIFFEVKYFFLHYSAKSLYNLSICYSILFLKNKYFYIFQIVFLLIKIISQIIKKINFGKCFFIRYSSCTL